MLESFMMTFNKWLNSANIFWRGRFVIIFINGLTSPYIYPFPDVAGSSRKSSFTYTHSNHFQKELFTVVKRVNSYFFCQEKRQKKNRCYWCLSCYPPRFLVVGTNSDIPTVAKNTDIYFFTHYYAEKKWLWFFWCFLCGLILWMLCVCIWRAPMLARNGFIFFLPLLSREFVWTILTSNHKHILMWAFHTTVKIKLWLLFVSLYLSICICRDDVL